MKETKINLHSIVDVITNSSTEIFINCHSNTVGKITEFFNKMLKMAGATKSFEDLYDVEIREQGYMYVESTEDYEKIDKIIPIEDVIDDEYDNLHYDLILKPKTAGAKKINFNELLNEFFNIFEGER